MQGRDGLALELRRALGAKIFDPDRCGRAAKALKAAGLDTLARMDLDHLLRQLRDLEGSTSLTRTQKARLLAAFDRIRLAGSRVAISNARTRSAGTATPPP